MTASSTKIESKFSSWSNPHYTLMVLSSALLLPLSFLYALLTLLLNRLEPRRPALDHAAAVAGVQRQVRAWADGDRAKKMCTARPTWKSVSPQICTYKVM